MFNKVMLIGRLTRDPEARFFPSGSQVTTFSIAVNRKYKVNDQWKDEVYYFDIETFGTLAKRIEKQLSKGTQVLIEGQLRQDRWETSNGEKRSKIKIVATKILKIGDFASDKNKEDKNKENETAGKVEDIEDIEDLPYAEDVSSDEDVPF